MSAELGPSLPTPEDEVHKITVTCEGFEGQHLTEAETLLRDDGYSLHGSLFIRGDIRSSKPHGEIYVQPRLRQESRERLRNVLGISLQPVMH